MQLVYFTLLVNSTFLWLESILTDIDLMAVTKMKHLCKFLICSELFLCNLIVAFSTTNILSIPTFFLLYTPFSADSAYDPFVRLDGILDTDV